MSKESLVIPSYNKEEIKIGILHLGVGNFHRAHQALYINDYLNLKNDPYWGICGVNLRKEEREKEKEIKFMLDYRFGLGTYDEMLGMRRQIRKEREDTIYAAMEAKRQLANNAAIAGLSLGIISVLGGGMYLIVLATQ